jgi:hypothetical protein
LATLQQDRERVLVGQHHQQEMEEDDDAQSPMRTRGRGSSGPTEDNCGSTAVSCDGSGERRRMSWRRRARRGGRVTHTCHRHDLTESLYQVRSRRRSKRRRDLKKEPDLQAKQRKQESSILLIDLVLSFVSFGRILGEIGKRMLECRRLRNLFFILRIFTHSF